MKVHTKRKICAAVAAAAFVLALGTVGGLTRDRIDLGAASAILAAAMTVMLAGMWKGGYLQ